MEQENKEFDFSPVGTVGAQTDTSSIDKSLKEIIDKLDEINNTIKGSYEKKEEIVEQPVIETPVVEETIEEPKVEAPVIEDVVLPTEPVIEAPVVETPVVPAIEPVVEEPKIEEITEVVEEPKIEDTFSPVEEPVSIEEPKNDSIISMDDLLAEDTPTVVPYEEPKVEEATPVVETPSIEPVVTPVVDTPVAPIEPVAAPVESVAAPVVEPVQNIEVPTIEIPAAPAIEPAVTPVVDTPVVETPVAPIEPVVAPVENVATQAPAVEAPVVAPAAPVSDKYTVVTNMYPSSLEVKTGNEPHFVVPVADNSKLTKKDEKTLIMNKTA